MTCLKIGCSTNFISVFLPMLWFCVQNKSTTWNQTFGESKTGTNETKAFSDIVFYS